MQFDLDDDQKAIQAMLEDFLGNRLNPVRALEISDAGGLDSALWEEAMSLGLAGTMVPEEHAGLGSDLLTLAVIAEAFGRFAVSLPVLPNALAAWVIARYGSVDQQAKWLSGLLDGSKVAAFALGEADSNGGPDSWRLETGASITKTSVEWGAHAHVFLVGLKNGSLGLVAADDVGVSVSSFEVLDRTRPLADVCFDSAPIEMLPAADETLGRRVLDALLILLSADAYGAGSQALDMATEYAKERVQFGQAIGAFQAIKHQLANLAVEVLPSRALYWYAAHAWDQLPAESERAAALAKAHLGAVAVRTARLAVEIHGGIGYTWEYPLHLWLKRAMYDSTALGDAAQHHERVAQLSDWVSRDESSEALDQPQVSGQLLP
ncbi:acyl-CoA dehydrogenase family protein [Pseudomonas sp. NFX224]|uniref:acyl-CoA dehydrogenase family protein n=1 Tax=Pseudomonas sp. NFX224 TaxID=3402862 RepID=UPI003AFB4473